MTDTATGKSLRVLTSTVGPYLMLPYSQVGEVRHLLDAEQIAYEVAENVVSVDGGPEYAWITFGRKGNSAEIQAILDRGR